MNVNYLASYFILVFSSSIILSRSILRLLLYEAFAVIRLFKLQLLKPSVFFLHQLSLADSFQSVKNKYIFLKVYKHLWKTNCGDSELFDYYIHTFSYTSSPLEYKFNPLRETTSSNLAYFFGYFHQNFGHLSLIDVYARAGALGFDNKKFIFLRSPSGTANDFYLDLICTSYGIPRIDLDSHSYYSLNSKYIRSRQLIDPFGFYFANLGQYELYKGWNLVLDASTNLKPLISFPEYLIKNCEGILESNFLDSKKPFVTLHTRYTPNGPKDRSGADTSLLTYRLAIESIIARGFNVVRIGAPEPDSIEIPGYLDSGKKNLPDFFDIYLLSKCFFMIGCGSGPLSVPPTFGVPVLYVNAPSIAHIPRFPDSRFIPQHIYSTLDGHELNYEEVLSSPLGKSTLNAHNLYTRKPNTNQEIKLAVDDFFSELETGNLSRSSMPNTQKSILRSVNAYHTSGMILSKSFLYLNPSYLL